MIPTSRSSPPRSRLAWQVELLRALNRRYISIIQLSRTIPIILCGVWMIIPVSDFDPFRPDGSFHNFEMIAPRYVWGAFCYLIAIIHIIGILNNNWTLRRVATLATLFWWLFLALFLFYDGQSWRLVTALIIANAISSIMFLFALGQRSVFEQPSVSVEREIILRSGGVAQEATSSIRRET